jgi:hypothetical protein
MNHIIPEDKLKTTTLGDLTQTQLYSTSSATFIGQRKALEDLILIWKSKMALATYNGTVLPDNGGHKTVEFTDAPPTGTQLVINPGEVLLTWPSLWSGINGAGAGNDVKVFLVDVANNRQTQIGGTTTLTASTLDGAITTSTVARPIPSYIKLTSNLTLAVVGTQSDESSLVIPFQLEAV